MSPRPHKSLRWRFVLWLAFLLILVLSGFGVTAYQLHRLNRFTQLDEELKLRVTILSGLVRSGPPSFERGGRRPEPPDLEDFARDDFGPRRRPGPNFIPRDRSEGGDTNRPGLPERFGDAPPGERFVGLASERVRNFPDLPRFFDQSATNGFYFVLWQRGPGSSELLRATNAPGFVPRPESRPGDIGSYARVRHHYREMHQFTERGDCVLVGKSIATELQATRHFALWLVLGGVGILALGIGGTWFIAGQALKPVREISAAADRISGGNLAERINVRDTDNELGALAQTLNTTFARLEAAFARQQQFTADASHELRTPLAVMITEAQTTLARSRSAAEYRETIQTFLTTAQQMRALAESLLELARYDAGQTPLTREPFDLSEVVLAATHLLQPLARQNHVAIQTHLAPIVVRGDADRLRQVITNLLANAIHYNRPGGWVRLETTATSHEVKLSVADNGIGIAAEALPHLFERFYRADPSRSRASGHSGLGLAICHAIVTAHGGTLTVTSQPDHGATFTLTLPTTG